MKVIRAIFWTITALAFGALAGLVIGGITLAAGLLILRDVIFRRKISNF